MGVWSSIAKITGIGEFDHIQDKADRIINDVESAVKDVPLVGDVTSAVSSGFKTYIRPAISETLAAVGTAVLPGVGTAIGSTVGNVLEGKNSDEILREASIAGAIGWLAGGKPGGGSFAMSPSGATSAGAASAAGVGTTAVNRVSDIGRNAIGNVMDVGASIVRGAGKFISDPVGFVRTQLGNLGETAREKLSAELARLPDNMKNTVMDIIKGGGDAAQATIDSLTSGGGVEDLIKTLGSAYFSNQSHKERMEAIDKITNAQLEANRESLASYERISGQALDLQKKGLALGGPWREAGTRALSEISQLYGLGSVTPQVDPYTGGIVSGGMGGYKPGPMTKEARPYSMQTGSVSHEDRLSQQQDAMSRFQTSPGYTFRRDEGLKAIDRLASARGYLGSTRAAREAQRYGEGLASSEYDTYVNRLANLAGAGQTGAGQGSQVLSGAATNQQTNAANVADMTGAAGDIRASGYLSQGALNASKQNTYSDLFNEYMSRF